MDKNYTVYHLHDEASLLDSCTNYKLYVDKAVELGQKAIAFTNHGNIYNWVEKKMYVNSKGLKYIHGVEVYLTEFLEPKVRDNYHTILLAKNYEGVKEINRLIGVSTRADHIYYKPRISFDEFFNISDNVIKISACLASPLSKYPKSVNDIYARIEELNKEKDNEIAALEYKMTNSTDELAWISSYTDNVEGYEDPPWYYEGTPHDAYIKYINEKIAGTEQTYKSKISSLYEKINRAKETYEKLLNTYDYYEIQPHVKSTDQIKYNKMLYEASKKYNKPLIAGTDTHSLDQYKAECRSILQKAKKIEFSDEDKFDLTYKSYEELLEMFKKQNALPLDVILEAIENTNKMADSIEDFVLDTSVKYPKLYDDEEAVLKELIRSKLKEKIDKGIIDKKNVPKYKKNIMEEMRVFKKINMIGFMLFMSELINWCWENNIPTGFCRGSVGGSTVAYITDIIDVDPVAWNTIFSRFANESREEVGDIDVDLSPDQRDLVYQHIIDTFGLDKTAYILAIGTISDKGTIDEIGRALNIPLDEVAHIKELYSTFKEDIDSTEKRLKEITSNTEYEKIKDKSKTDFEKGSDEYNLLGEYEKVLKTNKAAKKNMDDLKRKSYPEIFYYFDGLNGTAVSQSYHPAGIVVSPITLPDNFGIFYNNEGKHIMCINMEEIHDGAGLVKYDLLALKNIQIIRKTCEYAGLKYPKSHEVDWFDKNVWKDIICSKAGIFQFESDYAFEMLKNFKPTTINHLSMINASLRPSGASYRDRLLSGEINKNPSPLIDELLKDNRGFLIFQEDVIAFLQKICGLSGSESDNVRRAIGRKQMDRLQAALPQILEGYCSKSSQPREVAEEEAKTFLKIIEDASSYMFGFNHSTGYSMIGYTCAYYRYYYPEEFIAAYLNCASNDDDIKNGTELAKIKGVTIHNIKFGKSRAGYTIDKKNHALYKGIESIKFCNAQIAEELYELSKNKYDNFIQLLIDINEKTSIDSRQLDILIGLNFFSDFGKNKYLFEVVKLCNGVKEKTKTVRPPLLTCKQLKKDKLESYGIPEYIAEKYSEKETAKQYSQIDNIGLVTELSSMIEDKSLSIIEQVKFEKDYLNYIVYTNQKIDDKYYIVSEYKTYKNPALPYLELYNLNTGETVKTKIKKATVYKENPFGQYSVLRVPSFIETQKRKKIGDKWVLTDETEPILEQYKIVRRSS